MDEYGGRSQVDDAPPSSGAGQREVRRLVRPTDRKVLAGVAAGLGDYFDVDPVLFRVGFVVATFLGGAGALAYGLAWLLIPASHGPATEATAMREPWGERLMGSLRSSPGWIGVVLLIVGGALVLSQIGFWHSDVVWGVALIVLGVLLFQQGRHGRTSEDAAEGTARPATAAEGAQSWAAPTSAPDLAPSTPTPPSPASGALPATRIEPSLQPARRERSPLGWVTLGCVLVAVGVTAVLQGTDTIHLSAVQLVALPLAIVGLGLLIGAWFGRARWLIVPGLLLIPLVLGASLIHVPLEGGFGNRFIRPTDVAAVQPAYRLVAGQIELDLRDVPVGFQTIPVTATNVAGSIRVLVPGDIAVRVHAKAGAGEVDLFGQTYNGLQVDVRRSFSAPAPGGQIDLDLEASFGQVSVGR